jgi:hypothetical protein
MNALQGWRRRGDRQAARGYDCLLREEGGEEPVVRTTSAHGAPPREGAYWSLREQCAGVMAKFNNTTLHVMMLAQDEKKINKSTQKVKYSAARERVANGLSRHPVPYSLTPAAAQGESVLHGGQGAAAREADPRCDAVIARGRTLSPQRSGVGAPKQSLHTREIASQRALAMTVMGSGRPKQSPPCAGDCFAKGARNDNVICSHPCRAGGMYPAMTVTPQHDRAQRKVASQLARYCPLCYTRRSGQPTLAHILHACIPAGRAFDTLSSCTGGAQLRDSSAYAGGSSKRRVVLCQSFR